MTQREAQQGGQAREQAGSQPIEVEVTCPDAASARRIARAALQGGLVACANILPGVESLFRWQGQVESEGEVLVRLKARFDGFEALSALILRLHPYDLPAIVALPVLASGPGHEDWLSETIAATPQTGTGKGASD